MSRYDVVIVCERDDPGVRKVLLWLHKRGQDLVNVDGQGGIEQVGSPLVFSREVWAGAVYLDGSSDELHDQISEQCLNRSQHEPLSVFIREQGHPLRDNGTKGGQ